MLKNILFLIPLLLVLSCKKEDKTNSVTSVTIEPDMSEPFKEVHFSDYTKSNNFILHNQTDINYLGFTAVASSIAVQKFNPFVGVRLVNTGYSLMDAKGQAVKTYDLKESVLSEYRNTFNGMLNNSDHIFTPQISFQIHAPEEILTAKRTNISLVLRAVYYYLDIYQIGDDNFNLNANLKLNDIKSSGAYLSKIGYGQEFIFEIASEDDPKKVLVYLRAYLKAILSNNGVRAVDLSKRFDLSCSKFTQHGGPFTNFMALGNINNAVFENIFKNIFVPKQIKSALTPIDFEFKSFNKN